MATLSSFHASPCGFGSVHKSTPKKDSEEIKDSVTAATSWADYPGVYFPGGNLDVKRLHTTLAKPRVVRLRLQTIALVGKSPVTSSSRAGSLARANAPPGPGSQVISQEHTASEWRSRDHQDPGNRGSDPSMALAWLLDGNYPTLMSARPSSSFDKSTVNTLPNAPQKTQPSVSPD
ncbi:hypothetical protein JHW43_008709 [Diplocarpon mali]|nr:hypothetical protein JHW43_008709 [Diplocarpon mali]